jgi:hypothetical protein
MSSRRATAGSWPAHERVILSCDAQPFTVRDVLDCAWFRGELETPWRRSLQGRACEAQAAESGREPDAEILQTMSEEFRYQHELLTAEETERWLAGHDLSEDDFAGYFARAYWLDTEPAHPVPPDLAYPQATPEILDLLRIDLLMSGEFDSLCRSLSWRAAAARAEASSSDAERGAFFERTGIAEADLAGTLDQLGRDLRWFHQCLLMEAAFNNLSRRWLDQEKRARALASRRHGLTRLQLESFLASSPDAAREAVLCLRENEASMTELAEACGSHCEQRELFLEDFAPELQQLFVCAAPGEVLELPQDDSGFLVCRVAAKLEPDLTNAIVASRIDESLLQARFSDLTRDCIQWVQGNRP